jgi:dienelactone hydrolase
MAEIGWRVICRRAFETIRMLPDSTILAGFSMGAGVIASLWDSHPQTKAVLLFHGLAEIPSNVRPGLKVQTHIACIDQFVSTEARALWAESAQSAGLVIENHNYVDAGHFFTDFNSTDYSASASELAWKRTLDFLDQIRSSESNTGSFGAIGRV